MRANTRFIGITFACACAILMARAAGAQDGFKDYGVAAKVAECRGRTTAVTKDGRNLIVVSAYDKSKRGYLLVTDIDSGVTTQHYCPPGVPRAAAFGSLMSKNGKYYISQGPWFLEFDPEAGQWTFHGIPSKDASTFLCVTQGYDGTVWAGGTYKSTLISLDPETHEMKDHGRMDPREKYLWSLAVDKSGWVYGGIGTARCNIVAYNPRTGEKRPLLKDDDRVHGTARVYPTTDGAAYGLAGEQFYRLSEGRATPIERAEAAPRLRVGQSRTQFPDGRHIIRYDLPGRRIEIQHPKTEKVRAIEFDYQSEGVGLTSLGEGPNGIVYGSTCHPMRFIVLDMKKGTLEDWGSIPSAGNFCAITHQGDFVIGAQYSKGELWAYDVKKPWNPFRRRKTFGIPARQLITLGECKDGHFTYLTSHDVVFFHGDKFGAEGTFRLMAPTDGPYYLHIAPYRSRKYCTVQFLFDGKEIGEPYVATCDKTGLGELLVYGPLDLKAGEHRLTMKPLRAKTQEPWCAVCSVELGKQKREHLVVEGASHPTVLAKWKRDICRPRTALAHPDGKHVMMAGYAGYGLCGGGIGIVNLETKEETLLTAEKDLLPGHSCITLKTLPNGDLVGGTSVAAPGGGHATAKEGELFIVDWETKKLTYHTVPVPSDGHIISIQVLADGLVYGLSSKSVFFVFDPSSREVVHSESFKDYGAVPRHALQIGPDGKLYAMLRKAIVRVHPGTFRHEKLAEPPVDITAGGALVNGKLCFANVSHVWTYDVPGL